MDRQIAAFCNPSSWSAPEDFLGVSVLLVAFPFMALDLIRTGGWRGCALSASWCVTYEDPIGQTDGLPQGTWCARLVAMVGTTAALVLRLQSLKRMDKPFSSIRMTRKGIALYSLILSNIAMVSCAFIPMSCGDLHDGREWCYVSWRDFVHDSSLYTIYLATIISGFAAGYTRVKGKRVLLFLTIIFAIVQSVGIYRCPTSSDIERLLLLVAEVLAIALAQFLHYGTSVQLGRAGRRDSMVEDDGRGKEKKILPT